MSSCQNGLKRNRYIRVWGGFQNCFCFYIFILLKIAACKEKSWSKANHAVSQAPEHCLINGSILKKPMTKAQSAADVMEEMMVLGMWFFCLLFFFFFFLLNLTLIRTLLKASMPVQSKKEKKWKKERDDYKMRNMKQLFSHSITS